MRQSIHLLLFLAIPGFVTACQRDMAAHRRAWEAARPSSYVFEYQRTCFCPASGAWWRITVKRDSVTDAQLIDSTGVTRGLRYIHTLAQPTLSELFTEIAANLEPATAWARVDYDPQWHFPINATGDVVDRTDSKWTLIVRHFRSM